MKTRYACAVIFPMLVVATSFGQQPQQSASTASVSIRDEAAVTGVWRGQFEGLPWATITLTDEGGGLSGAILFYLHRREPGGQVTSSTPSVPEPLLNPHFDGQTLIFGVSHRHAHPPGSLTDPPVHFQMDVTSKDHATLVNQDDRSRSAALVRSDY
jgi:hypothetical protein